MRSTFRSLVPLFMSLVVACGEHEPEIDSEAEDRTYLFGDTRYTLIATTKEAPAESSRRLRFIEQSLHKHGILFLTNGSLGVTSVAVPVEDEKRAKLLLAELVDDEGWILPLK